MDIFFDETHLKEFNRAVAAAHDPDDVSGKHGQTFGLAIPDVDAMQLPTGQVKRSEVFALASSNTINTATACAAIMAWGGMQMHHRDMLFKASDRRWCDVAEDIRNGEIDRKTAYDRLSELRQQGALKGAGPAYFTKLIYFLTPRGNTKSKSGYIMDQWAGCSVNLLAGREIVRMNVVREWRHKKGLPVPVVNYMVSDLNDAEIYEEFCCVVDALAATFDLNADQIDRALLSDGGRNPKPWRQYVTRHRSM